MRRPIPANTKLFALSFAVAMSQSFATPSYAEVSADSKPGGTSAPESANADKPDLSGGVASHVIKTHVGLKEVQQTAKTLQRAALDMIEEVERTQWEVATMPDAFGPIVSPAVSFPTQGLGELSPPRKKWVDYLMKQFDQLITMLQTDLDSTVIPDGSPEDASQTWEQMKAVMPDMHKHYEALKTLTKGPKYDNIKIGKEALGIYDDVTRIEGLNKKIAHHMHSHFHQTKQASTER